MDILTLMKSNEAYSAANSDMPMELQKKAKRLCWEYNMCCPDDAEKRAELLRQLLGTCHPLTFIQPDFQCDYGFNIHTHGLTVVNHNVVILDTSPVYIGANAFLAPGVCLSCVGHAMDAQQRAQGILTSAPITLEDDVWIGANVTVCGGVTIGKGSIIGAGSVVTRDIPAGVVAAGTPCRVLRPVTERDRIETISI
ncbi:sugar O-acetyltransferase [Butyricicoccus sp.]|uniref:sugar O-acetyltransferase n=1 Tax=Butyricicoccus sp. TaxID=2049021 RepID=UPI003F165683